MLTVSAELVELELYPDVEVYPDVDDVEREVYGDLLAEARGAWMRRTAQLPRFQEVER